MISPFLIGLAAFVVYPVCATLYYSLTNFQEGSYRPVKFVGLHNYVDLLTQSDTFWIAVRNTLWMVIIMVPLRTPVRSLRCLVDQPDQERCTLLPHAVLRAGHRAGGGRGAGVHRACSTRSGPVNTMLARFGIAGPGWFSDPALGQAEPADHGALGRWRHRSSSSRPPCWTCRKELYEAADLDGVERPAAVLARDDAVPVAGHRLRASSPG